MNALTPTDIQKAVEAGMFQGIADSKGTLSNPFAAMFAMSMMPMQILMASQQQLLEQIQPEIESALYFANKGQQMMLRNMGLGS